MVIFSFYKYMYSIAIGIPRFPGGMVARMKVSRSLVVRAPQARMKFDPVRAAASFRPARFGRWQLAQCDRYAARPRSDCPTAYDPTAVRIWPEAAAIPREVPGDLGIAQEFVQ